MPSVSHSFPMPDSPEDACARFRREIEPVLNRAGFRLASQTDRHLEYGVGYKLGERVSSFLVTGWLVTAVWALRKLSGRRLKLDFLPDSDGTRVDAYGRLGFGLADAVNALGRPGHWPSTLDDPLWAVTEEADPLAEWDGVDVAEASLDRITKRALRKSGRL